MSQEVHNHYHYHYSVIPNNSDCFACGCLAVAIVSFCALMAFTTYINHLPH